MTAPHQVNDAAYFAQIQRVRLQISDLNEMVDAHSKAFYATSLLHGGNASMIAAERLEYAKGMKALGDRLDVAIAICEGIDLDSDEDEAVETCHFCKKTIPHIDNAIDTGWLPTFIRGEEEIQGPVCGDCIASRSHFDEENGDYVENTPAMPHMQSLQFLD